MARVPLNGPLCATVFFWAVNFVSIKVIYREMEPPALALIRFLVMGSVLYMLSRARGHDLIPPAGERRPVLLAGLMSMGVYMVLFLEGMARTSPGEGAVMLATAPLLTYLVGLRRGTERFLPGAAFGTGLAFLGVGMVAAGGGAETRHHLAGNGLVLLSAVAWASSALLMGPLVARREPLPVFTYSLLGAFPVMLIYGLSATLRTDLRALSTAGWAHFAQISLGSGVVAFLSFYIGVRAVGPAVATLYQYCVPPLAALLAWATLGQSLAPAQWAGIVTVLVGCGVASRARAVNSRA